MLAHSHAPLMDLINSSQEPPNYDIDDTAPPVSNVGQSFDTHKKKRTKIRCTSYSTHEDILLCKSWLATSMDPVCGIDQKCSKYWENVHKFYHAQKYYVETCACPTTLGMKDLSNINGQ